MSSVSGSICLALLFLTALAVGFRTSGLVQAAALLVYTVSAAGMASRAMKS